MTNTNIQHILKTAPTRGASPTRAHPPRPTAPRMPSPRASPAMRPTSPLSPRFESAARFDNLQPPSPRSMHTRTAGNSQRRANTNSLKLPQLPRFHPANFPSSHSSAQNTPDAPGNGTPQAPQSPRAHQRVVSDAQKHLLMYQREMVTAARATSPVAYDKPISPRLRPLGSPGPVTPLELEGKEGYLVAGMRSAGKLNGPASEELVDRLIREESSRQRRTSSRSPSYGEDG